MKILSALLTGTLILGDNCAKSEPLPMDFDKTAVQFLFTKAGTNFEPLGTCFGVNVSTVHHPTQLKNLLTLKPAIIHHFGYFVTAKHVLFEANGKLRPEIYLRINNRGTGITYTPIGQELTNSLRILIHTNHSVDLAAITINTPEQAAAVLVNKDKVVVAPPFKVGTFESSIISDTDDFRKFHIREGDEMFFVGLFTPFYGSKENVPICRFGRLAMVTEEPIPWANGEKANLYLMETEAYGGNSGSPAFFYFPRGNRNGPWIQVGAPRTSLLLAGVVTGYFRDWSEVIMANPTPVPYSAQHLGVTAIVPARYLREILFSDEERQFREKIFKAYRPKGY